jgi:hypothetical protein
VEIYDGHNDAREPPNDHFHNRGEWRDGGAHKPKSVSDIQYGNECCND